MLKKLLIFGGLVVALALWSVPAQADSVGTLTLTGCGGGDLGCPNATYSFSISSTSATLTIHITGAVTTGVNNQITGVNLGFSPSGTVSGLSLPVHPSGTWTFATGSLSNSGCGANSGAFVCASSSTGGVTIVQGGTYTWTWNYTLAGSIFGADQVHIGANYDPHNGLIVSQTGATPIPEPGTLALFGSGLLGIAGIIRRRLSA